MALTYTTGDYHDGLMPAAVALRYAVFVIEQRVPPELELDAHDAEATHLFAVDDGHVVGTLRIFVHDGVAKVGRVAVHRDARGRGIGAEMMRRAMNYARGRVCTEMTLDAQTQVAGFYEALGFHAHGDVFMDAGIPHIAMSRTLGPAE